MAALEFERILLGRNYPTVGMDSNKRNLSVGMERYESKDILLFLEWSIAKAVSFEGTAHCRSYLPASNGASSLDSRDSYGFLEVVLVG